eukprot:CAMPEP_0181133540 /NCGR_PEP_ID=MMETSP1071-20121207/31584_1 /TAXON_ID=35127 /ORGANISM="Thalassiosira sp., Strain NH16" /LENGTH=390 /DNA_ID=CAMNT_0023219949 /DNA_START=57 /DNA_END=1229 /DNA_ORIENTATION=-
MLRYHFLVCILFIGSAEGSNSNGATFSPVRELGPSLAASVAGGTIIAARSSLRPSLMEHDGAISPAEGAVGDDDGCLVVLFRSPMSESGKQISDAGNLTISSVFGSQADDDKFNCNDTNNRRHRNDNHHGLSFLPNGPVNFPFLPSSSSNNLRILHAPSGLLVAATGFAPDADHILNVAAARVLSRISVFDAPSSPSSSTSSKSIDPHRLVREDLSSMMIDAAMSNGGRPLGVQLLIVGQSALPLRKENECPLELYTIDPSGGWRSCIGQGTAVGRGAERVRSLLFHSEHDSRTDTSEGTEFLAPGWRGALERTMMAAMEALQQDDDSNDLDTQEMNQCVQYGALVIFASSNLLKRQISASRCASVKPEIIEECYSRCYRKFMHNKKMAK